MALSFSENALLTRTCENMNVAANTCREVLEMLRSLGNTGVVDIATHNNAAAAHASAANLFHVDSDGDGILGGPVINIPNWSTYHMFRLQTKTGIPVFAKWSEKKPSQTETNQNPRDVTWIAMSDGNGNLVNKADVSSLYNNAGYVNVGRVEYDIATADGTRIIAIEFNSGSYDDTNKTHKGTQLRFAGCLKDGTYAFFYNFCGESITPYNTASIGSSSNPFDTAYFTTAATVTSDRRRKSDISAIGSEAAEFIKALRPVQFTVKEGRKNVSESDKNGEAISMEVVPGVRRHWGLIAQEVQEALVSAGYDPSDCAVWSLADKGDPDSMQALRYEELIAPMIKVIQQQQERIEALERKVA